ncbi:putative quinol monooxygenase [Gynuella sunshinyii]|uniref:ABM domain-containing protein n=1 Tax=Gynuella sunshinyii YC6258 TaxID=1445510 RepID=A0A0C5VNF1_9GAMM|nr:antibiotic biosynthesis monooxygenase [Gynuella sunshinyii]AJQ94918.1 hypothetical protein YC6258_02880 [Gynuella sunshinyii YC6258]
MSKVVLMGHIIVPRSSLEAVMAELDNHIAQTLQEPGCLVFDVKQDKYQSNRFNVYEEFVDNDAFEAHQIRVRKSLWGILSAKAERHYQVIREAL